MVLDRRCCAQEAKLATVRLYVAPGGNDAANGSSLTPFATLQGARDRIRTYRASHKGPSRPIEVHVRGGSYRLSEPLVFDAQDSGSEDAPVVYRADGDDEVCLVGGLEIPADAFLEVTDRDVLNRLPKEARGKVRYADLKKLGVGQFKQWPDSYRALVVPELFFQGKRMQLARYPNKGWLQFTRQQVIDPGAIPCIKKDMEKRGGTFEYTGDHPERWSVKQGVWLYGYWGNDWYDAGHKVGSIDPEKKRITLATPSLYGVGPFRRWNTAPRRYLALNLLEELDIPGEWYLDVKTSRLYFYPPKTLPGTRIVLSLCPTTMIQLRGNVQHVCLRGLVIECGQAAAVSVAGEDNLIENCEIRNMGANGIALGGRRNGVRACHLHHLGASGISINSGDRKTLLPAGNFIEDCHIHHVGVTSKGSPAIGLSGCGNRVSHNHIHDGPHQAIVYRGNDNIIEFNHIHRVVLETSDAGAIYTGRDWTSFGNVVRYNFIHDLGKVGLGLAWAIYLDDQDSGDSIVGNVLYKAGGGIIIGGGRSNSVENNIIIESAAGMTLDARGARGQQTDVHQPYTPDPELIRRLQAVPYREEPWKSRYPQLANILDDAPWLPKHNTIRNNLCVKCRTWIDYASKEDQKCWEDEANHNVIENNLVTDKYPGFANVPKLDFTLLRSSRVWKEIPAFRPIPFREIGPRTTVSGSPRAGNP